MLTQKNEDEDEFPVSFMSTKLQGAELKYATIDKQAFAVFKAVKHFYPYLLRSHTKIIVPHTEIRALLIQKEPRHRRGIWHQEAKGKHSKFQKLWLGLTRLPRKLVMQLTDCNLYRETWKTSLSMHPS